MVKKTDDTSKKAATKKVPVKKASASKAPAKQASAKKAPAARKKPAAAKTAKKQPPIKPVFWVGIGASAGGLEALREFVAHIPKHARNQITYIVAQHLSPKHQSMLVQLVGRETEIVVQELEDKQVPVANTIYITPPNSDVFVEKGKLRLRPPTSEYGPKPSVDYFLSSLAESEGDKAIAVILSGTGSDGAHGVRAVRAAGGLTVAQEPKTAKYDGMPSSAINTGCIDLVLPTDKMGPEIAEIIESPQHLASLHEGVPELNGYRELLFALKSKNGVDFKDYKTGTLYRRISRRMTACGTLSLDDYTEYTRKHPAELDELFQDIMISVTSFFRDPETFKALEKHIKEIIEAKEDNDPIRVWIPGCATGEEAYSIAILFAEAAGGISHLQQRFNLQIFATDLDVNALAHARRAVYPSAVLGNIDKSLQKKYFRHKDNSFEIVKAIRDMIVFSRHNVFEDPPFLRMDLISCRNLLIYFNSSLQQKVMGLFHYALGPNGLLFLGKSEALGQSVKLFQTVNSRTKLFKRKLATNLQPTHFPKTASYLSTTRTEPVPIKTTGLANLDLPDAFINALSPNSLLIDENMEIVRVYGDVSAYTQLSPGSATTNLMSLARKEFRQELRALVYKVIRENSAEMVLSKKMNINGKLHQINIIIRPLQLKHSSENLLLVSFERVKPVRVVEERAGRTADDPIISELEQELSATREHLQTVVEELETSNEELQSTNEEMQSTNEELQSANEELETANEELQSTNEELLTVNEELHVKSSELAAMNEDLSNIKESIGTPLLVVDRELQLTRFNATAKDLFFVSGDKIGSALTSITTEIDIPDLRKNVLNVIRKGLPFARQLDGDDKSYYERILPYRDDEGQINGAVLTYHDNTAERMAQKQLQESEERYELAVQGSSAGIWDWNIDSDRMYWSKFLQKMLGIRKLSDVLTFDAFKQRIHPDDRDDVMAILEAHLEKEFDFNVEFRLATDPGDYIWVHSRGQAIWNDKKRPIRMAGSIYNVTERRRAIEQLTDSNEALERFAYVCSHDLKEPARIIQNFTDLFVKQYAETMDEKAQECLHYIVDNAARMQEMIKNILTYSQIENKNIAYDRVNCEEEIERVLANLKLAINESGAVITHEELPEIRADRMQMFQIFQNLISNGIKFCKGKKPRIHIRAEEQEEKWVFSVRDNGIGMKAEYATNIFGVFQQLNRSEDYPGTGIGLSICHKVIAKHGGHIWVDSEPSKGSTFYFTIPKQLHKRREKHAKIQKIS